MTVSVDTLVVGARCAGAPLALSLARGGQKVLLVDAATLPSDQPMSSHFIQSFGMNILDELGLGDAVRDIAPPVCLFINGVGPSVARIEFGQKNSGSCPRRLDLDALLLQGAKSAGAQVETGVRLVELVYQEERVVGAVLEEQGQRREVCAKMVVGADGPRSTVAKLAKAEEYYGYDSPRASYWGYWPRTADYATCPDYAGGAAILHQDNDYFFIFPTNRDQTLVGVTFPIEELPQWRGRHKEVLFEKLRAHPFTAPLVQGEPLEPIRGLLKARFFFRQATGPGWALVGDAGLFKDPAPGLGISDALRDSQALAAAILKGGEAALEKYWRQRDVASLELFEFARDCGTPGYDSPLNRVVFDKLANNRALRDRVVQVLTREISPSQLFSTAQIVRWTLGGLCKGNWALLKPFLAAGKQGARVQKELEIRKALLDG